MVCNVCSKHKEYTELVAIISRYLLEKRDNSSKRNPKNIVKNRDSFFYIKKINQNIVSCIEYFIDVFSSSLS